MSTSSTTLAPFDDFDSASERTLAHLQERLGFGLWMTTRASGDGWIVLRSRDRVYDVEDGDLLPWASSVCMRMIERQAPQMATEGVDEIAGTDLSVNGLHVGAYVSVPIRRADGSLFGTLCALDPEVQPPELRRELPTVQTMARLLGTLLEAELLADERTRELGAIADLAMQDELTGALNRRGWRQRVEFEKERARMFGSRSCLLVIDLDNLKALNDREGHAAGDDLLRRTAGCLRATLRSGDALARMGGDEFSVLASDCDDVGSRRLDRTVREALDRDGIVASLGMASVRPAQDFGAAMLEADKAMYDDKLARRAAGNPDARSADGPGGA